MNKENINKELDRLELHVKHNFIKSGIINWKFVMDYLNSKDKIYYYDLHLELAML